MRIKITKDACPICGEQDDVERDIFAMTICYCRKCETTWNFTSGEVWGYDTELRRTGNQHAIDERKGKRRASANKYGWK